MNGIISEIKNIVIVITASELLKAFMVGEGFKKYITVCVNIIVIGFILSELKNIPLKADFSFESENYSLSEEKSLITEEYEKKTAEVIKNLLENENITVYEIKTTANPDYSLKSVFARIDKNRADAENIIKGMKPNSYEIYVAYE